VGARRHGAACPGCGDRRRRGRAHATAVCPAGPTPCAAVPPALPPHPVL